MECMVANVRIETAQVPRKQLCDQISHMKSRCSEASMHHMRSRCSDAPAVNHIKSRFSEGSMNEVTPMNSFVPLRRSQLLMIANDTSYGYGV